MIRTKPILRWPGGKSRMLKLIIPKIPPHVCYVEGFAGGAAVLLAKERSKVEVLNDLNGDIVALYRSVQFHLPELNRELEFYHASRKNLIDFMRCPGVTEIQKAARFLFRSRTSFGGNMNSFGVAKTRGGGVGFDHDKVNFLTSEAHKRLNGVVIENIPYERVLKNYDSKETFFFLDPPYLDAKVEAYSGWNRQQLKQFKRDLEKVQGKWLVTLDGSQFNQELFSDCNLEMVETQNKLVNIRTHGNQTFPELIITPK